MPGLLYGHIWYVSGIKGPDFQGDITSQVTGSYISTCD